MMPLRELHHDPDFVAPTAPSTGQRPCAFQACRLAAEVYPVVQLPPPAAARNGQPLRIVLRRSPVCDAHRRQLVAFLAPRLREALTAYCRRRVLPQADWGQAEWQWEPVGGGGR